MPTLLRATTWPLRVALALFAVYAVATVPSLLPRWGTSAAGVGLLAGWLALAALAWPIATGTAPPRLFWSALVAVAVALRLAALVVADGRAPIGDAMIYPMLARSLLDGQGLVFADPLLRTRFVTLYPPAYPLLLTGWGALFGTGTVALWTSNTLLDLAAAALLARLGAASGAAPAGRAAAWLFATWPTFALAAPFAQKEPLETLLVLAMLLALLAARTTAGRREAVVLGMAAGLLALTQPGLAPLPALLVLTLAPWLGLRRTLTMTLGGAAVAVLVMLPWWVRNAMLLHRFVPLTSTAGLGLWIGNNPDATGNWMALPAAYAGLPEFELSQRAAAAARAWIAAHPLDFVRLSAAKLVRTMGVEQFTLVRLGLAHPPAPRALTAALFPPLQGALAATLAAAALLAGRARRTPGGGIALLLAAAILAHLIAVDLWFEFAERHRYVLMPFLFLVVGAGLATPTPPALRRRGSARGGDGGGGLGGADRGDDAGGGEERGADGGQRDAAEVGEGHVSAP